MKATSVVWIAIYGLDSETTLREVAALEARLRGIDGLSVAVKNFTEVHLRLDDTESLEEAPPGSHEFARGFLLFSRMLKIRHELRNEDLSWEEAYVERSGRLEPTGVIVKVTHEGHVVEKKGEKDDG